VNLLDPDREPSGEQFALLMGDFLADVRARHARTRSSLREALEGAVAKARERNPEAGPRRDPSP
jgi:hypothetical protein